jgi:hypothetical protein
MNKEIIFESEKEFQKAIVDQKLEVYDEAGLNKFAVDLRKAEANGALKEDLEKAKRDVSKLVKVKVKVTRDGKTFYQERWVKRGEEPKKEEKEDKKEDKKEEKKPKTVYDTFSDEDKKMYDKHVKKFEDNVEQLMLEDKTLDEAVYETAKKFKLGKEAQKQLKEKFRDPDGEHKKHIEKLKKEDSKKKKEGKEEKLNDDELKKLSLDTDFNHEELIDDIKEIKSKKEGEKIRDFIVQEIAFANSHIEALSREQNSGGLSKKENDEIEDDKKAFKNIVRVGDSYLHKVNEKIKEIKEDKKSKKEKDKKTLTVKQYEKKLDNMSNDELIDEGNRLGLYFKREPDFEEVLYAVIDAARKAGEVK